MSNLDKEKLDQIIEEENKEKTCTCNKDNDKLCSIHKDIDEDLSNFSLLNNLDGEILEDLKMEDSFLNEIFFSDVLDSNSNILYTSDESPIFNEESYLKNLESENYNDEEIFVSEENPIFNEESYFNNLSICKDKLQSEKYREQLFIKEELNGNSDKKVVFDEEFNDDSYIGVQIEENDKQVIFDEIEKEEIFEFEKDEPQDLFDFEFIDEKNNATESNSNNEETLISFEQPPFEEYNLESIENDDNVELPIIDVEEEINNFSDDLDFVFPESNNDTNDDIEIEYVPTQDIEEFVLIDNNKLADIYETQEHDFIELNKKDFNEYKGVEVIETTDEVKGMFENFVSINENISKEFGDVEIIDTNDHVEAIDYSGYSIASYIQPEIHKEEVITKQENTLFNEYLNVETIYPGELPSWYTKPSQQIFDSELSNINDQPNLVINDKEVISKTSEIPSIEEQLKKIKRPNLFRKYTVASTANLVILKSIDRLLNLTNSVIERQKNK